MPGLGKVPLAKMVCYITGFDSHHLPSDQDITPSQWKDILKLMVKQSAVKNIGQVIVLPES